MRIEKPVGPSQFITGTFEPADLIVAVDVGSARVACAIAELGRARPRILAAESATSFGIRGGEIVDVKRASEAIQIAIDATADRAGIEVRTVVVGLSGDTKLFTSKAGLDLDHERRTVTVPDVQRLRRVLAGDAAPGRRIVHRFDGPYSIGDLHGIDSPEGLLGDRLEMQATFLSTAADRLDNLLKAVREAGVEIETVSLEPVSCSLGALSMDERALGAAVLDFGAGAFRGALWEGGKLRQIHIVGQEGLPLQSPSGRGLMLGAPNSGMEGVVMAIARRFRIAPATAERLLRSHAALSETELAALPASIEVAAVDGMGSVRIETRELSSTTEELLAPAVRSLREGLSGFSAGHTVGVVLTGGGARIRGMSTWISKRFGGTPVRLGVPRWDVDPSVTLPDEFAGCNGCSLAGLLALGSEARTQMNYRPHKSFLSKIGESIRTMAASL